MTLTRAKRTTIIRLSSPPRPSPKRVVIHAAPVSTFERRIQAARYTARKTWLKVGHSHGSQMPFPP